MPDDAEPRWWQHWSYTLLAGLFLAFLLNLLAWQFTAGLVGDVIRAGLPR